MTLNNLCTICARGGSKGVLGKNIREIGEKPLIAYTIEQAKESGLFEHVVISTDSDQIAKIAQKYGAEVFFKRSEEQSSDQAAKIPVIRHAFLESEKYYQKQYDVLVDLDATSPLRAVDDIVQAYNQFLRDDNENLITAMPSRRSPYFNLIEQNAQGKVVLSKKLNQTIVRRQDSPKCFDMNASIYIWKRKTILENDLVFLDTTGLYVMPEERSIDIDSELDFEFVEWMVNRRKTVKD
jgi:CMP-N,N'-diacetyllegionaminic acid synthase